MPFKVNFPSCRFRSAAMLVKNAAFPLLFDENCYIIKKLETKGGFDDICPIQTAEAKI